MLNNNIIQLVCLSENKYIVFSTKCVSNFHSRSQHLPKKNIQERMKHITKQQQYYVVSIET